MKSIGEILAPALRRAVKQQSSFAWLAGAWPAIVGKRLAAHTRPCNLTNGVLEIAVNGKDWRAELEGISSEFRTRVNESWGSSLVREVAFSDDRRGKPRLRHELDNEHTPFVRGRRAPAPHKAASANPNEKPDGR